MRWLLLLIVTVLAACEVQPDAFDVDVGGLPALTPDQEDLSGRGRCDSCHGASPAPAWAADPSLIRSIELRRVVASGNENRAVEQAFLYAADLSAAKVVAALGDIPSAGIWSVTNSKAASSTARLTNEQWAALSGWAATSGLFRFEGEAVTEFATHQETAFVFVRRDGYADCVFGSMDVSNDVTHPTFFALLEQLDNLAQSMDWQDESR